jgi:hypothetical protein
MSDDHNSIPTVNSTPAFGDDDLKFSESGDTVLAEDDDELVVIEEGYSHDQLPSVEDAKLNAGFIRTSYKKPLYYLVAFIGFIGLVASLAVVASKERHNSKIITEPESHVDQVMRFLFEHKITPEPTLLDKNSAQHFALQFVAAGDGYSKLDLLDNEEYAQRFIERYIMVVFYRHFHGPNWTYKLKFLTPTDHCNWFNYYETDAGDVVKEGISCDSDRRIKEIILRK